MILCLMTCANIVRHQLEQIQRHSLPLFLRHRIIWPHVHHHVAEYHNTRQHQRGQSIVHAGDEHWKMEEISRIIFAAELFAIAIQGEKRVGKKGRRVWTRKWLTKRQNNSPQIHCTTVVFFHCWKVAALSLFDDALDIAHLNSLSICFLLWREHATSGKILAVTPLLSHFPYAKPFIQSTGQLWNAALIFLFLFRRLMLLQRNVSSCASNELRDSFEYLCPIISWAGILPSVPTVKLVLCRSNLSAAVQYSMLYGTYLKTLKALTIMKCASDNLRYMWIFRYSLILVGQRSIQGQWSLIIRIYEDMVSRHPHTHPHPQILFSHILIRISKIFKDQDDNADVCWSFPRGSGLYHVYIKYALFRYERRISATKVQHYVLPGCGMWT